MPLIHHFDTCIFVKCVPLWLGEEFVIANPNLRGMRILYFLVTPMVLQGSDLRLNAFQEGEDDIAKSTSNFQGL